MNKTQLVDALAARMGDRRSAATAVDGLLETIVDTVKGGGTVSITGFGVFEARARAARVARNPRTGDVVDVPATTVPAFRPGVGFRTAVSGSSTVVPRATPVRRTRAAAAAAPSAPAKPARATKAKADTAFAAPAKAAPKKVAAKATPKATATKTAAPKTAATKSAATKSAATRPAAKAAPKAAAPKTEAKTKAAPKKAKAKK